MKAKEKLLGTKAQLRAEKKRERRIASALFLSIILLAVAFSAYFTYTFLNPSQVEIFIEPTLQFKPKTPDPQLKAAIVDQLSLTTPNETFMQTVAALLVKANYTVDYFHCEKVTVNFYRNLPESGYRLIILRVHSGIGPDHDTIFMFTSEPYSQTEYVGEQLNDQVQAVTYDIHASERPLYFAVLPKFIKECAQGRFNNTVIILMGCRGLETKSAAGALIEKGAKAYVGWNGPVSGSHTDTATTRLLQHLITEKQTIEQSVENTMKEVGPYPAYNSQLTYYPPEAGEQTIENIKR